MAESSFSVGARHTGQVELVFFHLVRHGLQNVCIHGVRAIFADSKSSRQMEHDDICGLGSSGS